MAACSYPAKEPRHRLRCPSECTGHLLPPGTWPGWAPWERGSTSGGWSNPVRLPWSGGCRPLAPIVAWQVLTMCGGALSGPRPPPSNRLPQLVRCPRKLGPESQHLVVWQCLQMASLARPPHTPHHGTVFREHHRHPRPAVSPVPPNIRQTKAHPMRWH